MRALIFELRPGNLEQDGLTRALRTHTAALQGRIGLPVVVESDLAGAAAARDRGGRSTGSRRRRSTTSSSTPARARSGSRSAGSPQRRPAADRGRRQGLRPRARPGRPPRPGRDARPRRQDRRPVRVPQRARAQGTTIEVVVPERGDRRGRAAPPAPAGVERRSATTDVGAIVDSAVAGTVDGRSVSRRRASGRRRIATCTNRAREPTEPLRVVVVDADDRVRESLAGLLRDRRPRRRSSAAPARPDAALDARRADPSRRRRRRSRACPTSTAAWPSSAGSAPSRPASGSSS